MSTKNNRILDSGSGRYPFKVSDEYFDSLTARIMDRVDEEERKDKEEKEVSSEGAVKIDINRNRYKFWGGIVSIAASLTLIVAVALKVIPNLTSGGQSVDDLTAEYTDDDYNEDLMTYTMVDNMDVYYYLASGDMEE